MALGYFRWKRFDGNYGGRESGLCQAVKKIIAEHANMISLTEAAFSLGGVRDAGIFIRCRRRIFLRNG